MVGAQPTLEIVAKENKVTILDHVAGDLTEKVVEDPVTVARSISQGWKPKLIADLPDAFCGKIFILMNIISTFISDIGLILLSAEYYLCPDPHV